MRVDKEEPSASALVTKPLTREALYKLVWSNPMLKVAATFGVSSSYMARVCTMLNVPRPKRGYWAKLAFGKRMPQPPLPEATAGDHLVWSRDGSLPAVYQPRPTPPTAAPSKRIRIVEPGEVVHPLLAGAKAFFEGGRLSYHIDYLKPTKKLLVDLAVSKTGLEKALSFANQLFLTLEARKHRVVIAPAGQSFRRPDFDVHEAPRKRPAYVNLWSPQRSTIVYIGSVAIGLTIIEMSEEVEAKYVDGKYVRLSEYTPPKRGRYTLDVGWTSKHEFAAGRIRLLAYSPYPRTQWQREWAETKTRDLPALIPTIVKDLENSVAEIIRLAEEARVQAEEEQKRWEIQQAQWRREEAERRAAEALKESTAELLEIIEEWAESTRLQAFFADAEQRIAGLPHSERAQTLKRLRRARDLIGTTDALKRFRLWTPPEER